jgi:hypothetical protein
MSFKSHWTEAINQDGTTVHNFHVAPLQIGGMVTVLPHRVTGCYVWMDKVYIASMQSANTGTVDEAKKVIENIWLPIIKRNAPHFLSQPTDTR